MSERFQRHMGMVAYELAVRLMGQYPEINDFMGPHDEALVSKAEDALGVIFPPTYRRFVLEYGAGNFGGDEFYGVITDNFTNSSVPNVVWLNHQNQKMFETPKHLIHIVSDGGLTDYFVDTSQANEGESPIISYRIGLPSESQQNPEVLAEDFGYFLLDMVREAIKFHEEND